MDVISTLVNIALFLILIIGFVTIACLVIEGLVGFGQDMSAERTRKKKAEEYYQEGILERDQIRQCYLEEYNRGRQRAADKTTLDRATEYRHDFDR